VERAAATFLYRQPATRNQQRSGLCTGKKRSREERSAKRMQRAALQKAQNSQFVKDLQAEVLDAPEEDMAVGASAARGTETLALLKQQQRLEARAAIEEDMMVCFCSLPSHLLLNIDRDPPEHVKVSNGEHAAALLLLFMHAIREGET
jgi:hypothetical protein